MAVQIWTFPPSQQQTPLKWFNELPTQEGWYYVQNRSLVNDKPFYPVRCVRVFYFKHWKTGEWTLCYDRAFYNAADNLENSPQDAAVLSELEGQNQWWCGPLPEPEIWTGEKQ